jgi:hypothetical protein
LYVIIIQVTNLTTTQSTQSGAPHAITDITDAAGWEIISCHPNKTEQEIQLVCTTPFGECGHLHANGGAEDKVLRLPDHVIVSFLALAALES